MSEITATADQVIDYLIKNDCTKPIEEVFRRKGWTPPTEPESEPEFFMPGDYVEVRDNDNKPYLFNGEDWFWIPGE